MLYVFSIHILHHVSSHGKFTVYIRNTTRLNTETARTQIINSHFFIERFRGIGLCGVSGMSSPAPLLTRSLLSCPYGESLVSALVHSAGGDVFSKLCC